MSIDFTKPITTRDGREVVLFGTDFDGLGYPYPVKGYIVGEVPRYIRSWTLSGRYVATGSADNPADLINPKPRIKQTVWVNVYGSDGSYAVGGVHRNRAQADGGEGPSRVACVEVTIDVEEGHGL